METEAILAVFSTGRAAAQERLRLITEKIEEQARLNKALRLNKCTNLRKSSDFPVSPY